MNIEGIKFKTCEVMCYENWYYIETINDFKTLLNELKRENHYLEFSLFNIKEFIGEWISYNIEYNYDGEINWCEFVSLKKISETIDTFNLQIKSLKEIIENEVLA